MKTLTRKKTDGFTIIEVLIVLAIAGLIMLVVFLAVPSLNRNQRNNARKSEASRVSTLLAECLSNKNGDQAQCDTPTELGFTQTGTVGALPASEFKELTEVEATTTANASKTRVIYAFGQQCNAAGGGFTATASTRAYAVGYKYESGSSDVWACING